MTPLDADALSPQEVAALKDKERENRDRGAAELERNVLHYGKSGPQLAAENRAYVGWLAPRSNERVLDAGAGLGRLALLVAPKVRELVCLDLSRGALQVLQAQAAAAGIRNVETVQADVCGFHGAAESFDAAYCVEVLGHIPSRRERTAALSRIRELLRPGGRCLVGVYAWGRRALRAGMEKEGFWGDGERRLYHYYFTPEELAQALEQAGFEDVLVRGLQVLPGRIAGLLGAALAPVEAALSTLPGSKHLATLLVGLARRPGG